MGSPRPLLSRLKPAWLVERGVLSPAPGDGAADHRFVLVSYVLSTAPETGPIGLIIELVTDDNDLLALGPSLAPLNILRPVDFVQWRAADADKP